MDAIRKIEELTALAERLKLEAQIHAQEATTENATIAEIYQLCTGATGEPGNWNGAEPVRQTLASKEAELARLRNALQLAHEHMQLYLPHYTPNHNVYQSSVSALTQPTE